MVAFTDHSSCVESGDANKRFINNYLLQYCSKRMAENSNNVNKVNVDDNNNDGNDTCNSNPTTSSSTPATVDVIGFDNDSMGGDDVLAKAEAISKEIAFGYRIFDRALQDQNMYGNPFLLSADGFPLCNALTPFTESSSEQCQSAAIPLQQEQSPLFAVSASSPSAFRRPFAERSEFDASMSLLELSQRQPSNGVVDEQQPDTIKRTVATNGHYSEACNFVKHQRLSSSSNILASEEQASEGMEIGNGGDDYLSVDVDGLMNSSSKNKLGRTYNPGRPLGMCDRQKILELYRKGLKISHIAKLIGVTHSCVSKIMTRYRRTGSMRPRCAQFSRRLSAASPPHRQPLLLSAGPAIGETSSLANLNLLPAAGGQRSSSSSQYHQFLSASNSPFPTTLSPFSAVQQQHRGTASTSPHPASTSPMFLPFSYGPEGRNTMVNSGGAEFLNVSPSTLPLSNNKSSPTIVAPQQLQFSTASSGEEQLPSVPHLLQAFLHRQTVALNCDAVSMTTALNGGYFPPPALSLNLLLAGGNVNGGSVFPALPPNLSGAPLFGVQGGAAHPREAITI